MTRPVLTEDGRPRRESEVIEVYAPPPPSADPPPGEGRPGQYIVNRGKQSSKQPEPMRDVPIPAGLGRPAQRGTGPSSRIPTSQPIPKPAPAPARPPSSTTPIASRTPPGGGGVVMTRPAVIVGAPAKPAPPQRVRKAREEEARGFGQGLISEKSLDEVILAYLSEDAEEK